MKAIQHIRNDLSIMRKDPSPGCSAGPKTANNLFEWVCTIHGPENTPYEGGIFHLEIKFPSDYPKKAPQIRFLTKIFHPNVKQDTWKPCLNIIDGDWSKVSKYYSIREVIISIQLLLINPNFESSYGHGGSREVYLKTAREWTIKYATYDLF